MGHPTKLPASPRSRHSSAKPPEVISKPGAGSANSYEAPCGSRADLLVSFPGSIPKPVSEKIATGFAYSSFTTNTSPRQFVATAQPSEPDSEPNVPIQSEENK
jgi:hypothetical protein